MLAQRRATAPLTRARVHLVPGSWSGLTRNRHTHAVPAAAAAIGLSADMDVADTNGWRDVAGAHFGGPHA
jgi:hypothetical protein